jgi:GT2 family glycosyltransferase
MHDKVAVIIPTYNRVNVTKKLVEKLWAGTYRNIQIIICDSDSSDGTQDMFLDKSDITFINVGNDRWWTGAINIGIQSAIGAGIQWILILNDDIDIPCNLIETMMFDVDGNRNIIASAAQVTQAGIFLGMIYSKILRIPIHVSMSGVKNSRVVVDSSNGCCLLMAVDVLERVGLFDEKNCPHLAADVEFQLRAGRLGYPTICLTNSVIHQQQPTNYYSQLKARNILTFEGSPFRLSAYFKLGYALFGGWISFAFKGVVYHYRFMTGLVKSFAVACLHSRW